ncbi:MAG: hypothetical protein ACRC24_05905 [Vibrionaceae bacterium]
MTQDSFLIKTDPATDLSCLKVVTSTGLLVDATATHARGSDCAGSWIVMVNGEEIVVEIDEEGGITFP